MTDPQPQLPRLAVVLSHPVQYYSPWFQWLARETRLPFRVFYLWNFGVTEQRDPQFGREFRWDIDLLSGYESEFVPNASPDPGTHHFNSLKNPTLPARLAVWRPEALLLFGYNWRSHLRALLWARCRGIPVLLRGDSHLLGRGDPGLTRRLLLRALFAQFSGFLTVGAANRSYYQTFGVPDRKLHFAPHCVQAERFAPTEATRSAAASLREELGLTGRRVLLFAGKLTERKQPVELLRAFLEVAGDRDAIVFVGDGTLRGELEAIAAARPDRHVRFLPFANQTEMPVRYQMADLFALPSRGHYETWGLAVNEAMHGGVPCLVSDLVGCQQDLVTPGETGWVFPAEDPRALVETVRDALRTPPDVLRRLGQAAQSRASRYTYAEAAAGLRRALAALAH